jgi:hypothetical protein
LRDSGDLRLAAIDLENKFAKPLQDLLARLQNEDFALFQAMIRKISAGEPEITSVLLASFQSGEPIAIAISFSGSVVAGKIVLHPKRLACPGMCPSGKYTFFLGKYEAIVNYVAEEGKHFSMSPENAVRFMVQLEIDAKTPGVGHRLRWFV